MLGGCRLWNVSGLCMSVFILEILYGTHLYRRRGKIVPFRCG